MKYEKRGVAIVALLLALVSLTWSECQAQNLIIRRDNSVGPWRARVANNGTLFNEPYEVFGVTGRPACVWQLPSGEWDTVAYGAGLWFGGLRKTSGGVLDPHVEFAYDVNHAGNVFSPGSILYGGKAVDSSQAARDKYRVYRSTDLTGPAWPMRNISGDAHYIDDIGARPIAGPKAVCGNEDMFVVYKDSDPTFATDSNGLPFDIEVRTTLSFWRTGALKDVIVVRNEIIYTGTDTIYEPAIGLALDGDIQEPRDDRTKGVRSEAGDAAVFFTAGSTTDPLLGGMLLGGQFGTNRVAAGMTSLRYWDIEDDPYTDSARYAFLTERRFDTALSRIGDARVLLTSLSDQPIAPGDTVRFDYALYAAAPSQTGALTSSDSSRMADMISVIRSQYIGAQLGVERTVPGSDDLQVYMTEQPSRFRVKVADHVRQITVLDMLGRSLITRQFDHNEIEPDLTSIPAGSYILRAGEKWRIVQR